jgi:NADH-quinone oxidoreductase subunit H
MLGAVVIPFGPTLVPSDLGIGVFYFIVVIDFVVLGVALTGWGANTPDAVESCYRIIAQLVAYVVPLGLAYVGAIMMARSLSTTRIVEAQSGLWFIVLQPIGFALYVVSGLMQSYRHPFLEPFADSIGGGVFGVLGGGAALLWRITFSGVLFLVAAMGVVLFLGGGSGPWLPPPVWMALKTYVLMALMLWLGRRMRPLSTAQMLALSWRVLIPIGLANVLVVGTLILLHIGPS